MHWGDLVKVANQILSFRERWWEHSTKGATYILDDDEWEVIDHLIATGLLCHLKAEFPEDFKAIGEWRDMLKPAPPEGFGRLLLVTRRRTFAGTCYICESWTRELT